MSYIITVAVNIAIFTLLALSLNIITGYAGQSAMGHAAFFGIGAYTAALMTNSVANNGNPFGASDYKKNKEKLLETGITVYEYEGGVSYHGKSITIGDDIDIVGSFNMDMRSAYLDTELMLVIDSKGVNSQSQGHMR